MTAKGQLLYLSEPEILDFQAEIQKTLSLPDGRTGVILDRSYFYPTGGGQGHDTGTLDDARVIEVIKQEEPIRVVHVLDRPAPVSTTGSSSLVHARIDRERRQRHSQHHTAQHLLTQCFVQLYSLDTISANINAYSPSTLDLPVSGLHQDQLRQAEDLANRFIYEDRQVRAYFVTPEALENLPLRRAPKVSEDIRIVEIDGFDYTPCGGTHCTATGQIGVIKIVKTEKQNERTRLHFVAGWQALELFQASYSAVSEMAARLSVGQDELPATLGRLSEQIQKLQKDLQGYQLERLAWESERLVQAAQVVKEQKVVMAIFSGRLVSELRLLGGELAKHSGLVSLLASVDGEKLTILATCGEGTGLSARDLLGKVLAPFQGRGGGDARLAQGGGTIGQVKDLEQTLLDILLNIL